MPKSYFPPRTLKEALCVARAIYENNAGNPMFRVSLAKELGQKAGSRLFRENITASSGYGLTNGGYTADKIELTERGKDVVNNVLEEVYEALFSVELFDRFYKYFASGGSRGLPSQKAAEDFLRNEYTVPESQLATILKNVTGNARDWFLIQDIAGGEKFVPRQLAYDTAMRQMSAELPGNNLDAPAPAPMESLPRSQDATSPNLKLVPGLQVNIQIHISPDTPDEKIALIFANMRKYLLSEE
jgi:hypothetical protein